MRVNNMGPPEHLRYDFVTLAVDLSSKATFIWKGELELSTDQAERYTAELHLSEHISQTFNARENTILDQEALPFDGVLRYCT
jgi:hypothetical protein